LKNRDFIIGALVYASFPVEKLFYCFAKPPVNSDKTGFVILAVSNLNTWMFIVSFKIATI